MPDTYAVKTVIIPNPTLAVFFHAAPSVAARRVTEYFKKEGNIAATVTPEWVRGPYTGTERCIEMQLQIPESMLSRSDEPAPFWKLVWELGRAG